ncbi:MAG: S8 family serine peptidase [Chitinophagales bacterium]
MKKWLILFLLWQTGLVAQRATRYDLRLTQAVLSEEIKTNTTLRPLLVKGDVTQISRWTVQCGGVFKFAAGNIASVAIPFNQLGKFAAQPFIWQIESGNAPGVSLMDTARIRNNIDSVQQGIAPLTQSYKGRNVVVGIIDGGIYLPHLDFRQANGKTRIRYVWDQVLTSGTAPSPYAYGSEWDSAAINSGTCPVTDPSSDQGHGTNVAGIACGNGNSVATHPFLSGKYTGVAPDANMVIVRLDFASNNFLTKVADAVDYVFKRADALGMPCVINTSQGTYYGSHDGNDLTTQLIENLLMAKRGRSLVAAAGNGGAIKHHVSYNLSPTDSQFTWFTYNTATTQVYFDLWADTAQFKQAQFAIGCDNTTPTFLGRTRYFNVIADFNPAQGSGVQIDDSLFNGSTKLGNYSILASLLGGTYHIEFLIKPVVTTNLWRLQTIGQGRFDLWASKSLINTSSLPTALPGGFTSPQYRGGDSLKTMVSSWQCSDKVITVANYSSRAGYLDKDSNYVNLTVSPYNEVVGDKFATSSLGPTRDGRMKPDIAATGSTTVASGDSLYIALLIGSSQGFKVGYGSLHTRNGGTSMASPVVTGSVALFLEKNPNAAYNEIKNAVIKTAKKDTFTTSNVPNYRFGYGKLNVYRMLLDPLIYGCKDTGSVNYNSTATVDTGGCVAKVYGCTDTGSINYNAAANVNNGNCIAKVYGCTDTASINYSAAANVNNGSCVAKVYGCTNPQAGNYNPQANIDNGSCFALGISSVTTSDFSVEPNPFCETVHFNMPETDGQQVLVITDAVGRLMDRISVNSKLVHYKASFPSGVYVVSWYDHGTLRSTRKLVAQ